MLFYFTPDLKADATYPEPLRQLYDILTLIFSTHQLERVAGKCALAAWLQSPCYPHHREQAHRKLGEPSKSTNI